MIRAGTRLGTVIVLVMLATGCGGTAPTSTSCIDIGLFGIQIKTFDAVTGAPVPVTGMAVAVDGSYREEAAGYPYQGGGVAYSMAVERAGRYRVTITVPGYQVWSRDNVDVKQGTCHVETVNIDARLAQ